MLEEPFFFLLSTDFPDLTEAKTSARTPPMRSKKSVKSVKSVDKKTESSMLEEPFSFYCLLIILI